MTNTTIYGDLTAVTSTGYDSQGRAVSRTDALSNTVFTGYDSLGLALSLSGATYPVQYAYDTASRQTELDTTRDGLAWDKTRFLFDGATGLLTNKVYADNSRVFHTYTSSGKPVRTTWARGEWKENAYDGLGQLAGVAYSDGTPPAFYAYTDAGFLAASSNAVVRYIYWTADSGVATNTAVLIGTNAFAVSKALDPFMRLAVFDTNSAKSPVIYGYNGENVLESLSNEAFEVAYQFDGTRDMGYAVTLTNGLTVTRAVTRDPHRRHLVTVVSNAVGASSHSVIAYGHDILGSVTNRNGDTFAYNPRSEVSGAVIGTNLLNYTYDGIGNLVWSADNALTNTYVANLLNQYTAISAPAREPQYDADGNLTVVGQLSLSWDAENRNTGILSNGTPLVANSYDPQHRRVIKTTPVATHTFLYDGWLPVLEKIIYSGGTAEVREHVWGKDLSGTRGGAGGIGGLLATRIGDAWYFPLCDANGNITDYVNESGASVAHREYDAFGKTLVATGPMANVFNFWFSTKYLDHETGLYYYGYRFYFPELMRFINRDPSGEYGAINLFGFVNNNPINRFDYLGLLEKKMLPLSISYGNLTVEAGNYRANESLICVCDPLKGDNKKKIKCLLLAMPQITLSSDKSVLNAAQVGSKYPDLSVEGHERNHHAVWLAQYIPKYEQLVAQYEGPSCCNCQKRIVDLQQNFQALKAELYRIEHMLEYGWADPSGKLVDYGGRVPWLDYGRDGDFLVDIPSPKEDCK